MIFPIFTLLLTLYYNLTLFTYSPPRSTADAFSSLPFQLALKVGWLLVFGPKTPRYFGQLWAPEKNVAMHGSAKW
jgi:hypothetical protein